MRRASSFLKRVNASTHVLYAVSALKLDAALCWTIHADKDSKQVLYKNPFRYIFDS